MRKHYPFIFSLNAVPALLRYPKLFARYSLRTILTATPTHTPCFRHRRRSCSLPSSKRGTPPFKIYSIGRVIAPREAYIIASQTLNLPFPICNLIRITCSFIHSAAFFVFLTATAGAGVVSAGFFIRLFRLFFNSAVIGA